MNRLLFFFLLCAALGVWIYVTKPPPPRALSPAAIAAAATRQVTIYTTDWCGYCKKAKAYMKEQGIRYVEYDIEKDSTAYAQYKQRGGSVVPLIVIGDKSMSGFNPDQFEKMLTE